LQLARGRGDARIPGPRALPAGLEAGLAMAGVGEAAWGPTKHKLNIVKAEAFRGKEGADGN